MATMDTMTEMGTVDTMRKLSLKEEEISQDLLSCLENDQLLRSKFDKWSAKYGRKYCSKKEREEKFKFFCRIAKLADEKKSKDTRDPNRSGLCLVPPMDSSLMGKPLVDCTKHSEELKEAKGSKNDQMMRIRFNKLWTTLYGKYCDEEVRDETFRFICRGGLWPVRDSLMSSKPSVDCKGKNEEPNENLKEAKQGHDLLPCSENEQSLRIMFAEWGIKHDIKYSTDEEREKRFQYFCRTKRMIDYHKARDPNCSIGLNMFADRRIPTQPYHPAVPVMHNLGKKYGQKRDEVLKEARVEFDKWAEKHRKVYSSEAERQRRFFVYVGNSKWLKDDYPAAGL